MESRPAGWSVCLPLLIFPCTIKSRSSLLAPAHPGGPGKRAIKQLWCGGHSPKFSKSVKVLPACTKRLGNIFMTSFRNADSVSVVSSSSGYGQSQATKKKKKKNLFVKFCNNDSNNKKDTLTDCQGGYTHPSMLAVYDKSYII